MNIYKYIQKEQEYGQDRKPGNQLVISGRQTPVTGHPIFKPLLDVPKSPVTVCCKNQPCQGKHGEEKREGVFLDLVRMVD